MFCLYLQDSKIKQKLKLCWISYIRDYIIFQTPPRLLILYQNWRKNYGSSFTIVLIEYKSYMTYGGGEG